MDEKIGLRWTGHPIVDMGVAAVTVATEVEVPTDVTFTQWSNLMDQLKESYTKGIFTKPSGILFTINAFDNPSLKKYPEKRATIIEDTFGLAKKRVGILEEYCAFFSGQLAVDRVSRDKIPLIHGQGNMNFYPEGLPGIAISALAIGSILAIPLVTPIVSGRFMIVAVDHKELLLDLCDQWYEELKKDYAKISLNNGTLSERKAPRSRLVDSLEQVFQISNKRSSTTNEYNGVVIYYLSNVGNGPNITIYSILPHIYHFLSRANAAKYRNLWQDFTKAFWLSDKGKSIEGTPAEEQRPLFKNLVFESLPLLPTNAAIFIRRFFLNYTRRRIGLSNKDKVSDTDVWPLLELFLTEIITMNKERIAKIRELADELADEIVENNDQKLYRQLMGITSSADSYRAFRQVLLRTLRDRLRRKGKLLLTLDEYLLLFEVGEEYPEANWHLVRDLMRIRCLESLHRQDYFTEQAPQLLEEEPEETATS